MSDTHMYHPSMYVPDGDVVIHAGDFTNSGDAHEMAEALVWFRRLPHARKICTPGNHDIIAEEDPVFMQDVLGPEVDYLDGTSTMLEGLKVWGSPIQPEFHDWAFNRTKNFRAGYWDEHMPDDADIVVTHCPPRNILDSNYRKENVGDKHLARNISERVKPLLHVFGHIHESRGGKPLHGTTYINASMVNVNLQPVFACWVFDYIDGKLVLVSR